MTKADIVALAGLLFFTSGCERKSSQSHPFVNHSFGKRDAKPIVHFTRPAVRIPGSRSDNGLQPLSGNGFSGPDIPLSPDPVVAWRWNAPKATDSLQIYHVLPIAAVSDSPDSFAGLASLQSENARVTVRGAGDIRLDFGVESAAWLEFDSPDLSGLVEMSISEYNQPAIFNAGSQSPIKTATPNRSGNTWRLLLNRERYEGVRFGWIHVRQYDRPWHITAVRLVCQVKPANYEGSFSCSDSLLTAIWYAGAYGVRLNFQRDHIGAILMERSDRHSWTGDAHPAQAASLAVFANNDFVRMNLLRTADISNGIASYPLYWVLSLADYLDYSGDGETFIKLKPRAAAILEQARTNFHQPDNLAFYGWDERLGAGFENPTNTETRYAYRMLWLRACRTFADRLASLGFALEAQGYRRLSQELFRSLYDNPHWLEQLSLHAAADAVNADMLNAIERAKLKERVFSDRLQRLSFSPFNQYFIIQALARLDCYQEALTTIRDCWGGQLVYGGTGFFEVFRPFWQQNDEQLAPPPNNQCGYTSLCHPWSSGVTAWLTREVLGIRPLGPGFSTYKITPHGTESLSWLAGQVLTPYGRLSVRFDFEKGEASVISPTGTCGVLGLPKRNGRIVRIVLDDRTVYSLTDTSAVTEDQAFVYLPDIAPGIHQIRYDFQKAQALIPVEPIRFAAAFLGEDSTTHGHWNGRYGSEGYALFHYTADGHHVLRLPAFIDSIAMHHYHSGSWPSSAAALQPPPDFTGSANLGFLATDNPQACRQSFTVDIHFNRKRPCRLSFYLADGDEANCKRSALELFDLQSKELLSPTVQVDQFSRGKYVSFRVVHSLRVRLYHIRGKQAVLSGIFFDPDNGRDVVMGYNYNVTQASDLRCVLTEPE
jgi:alpha-L-rhamnosidase